MSDDVPEQFMSWFRKNYPGPDTIIFKPDWHAPKIYRAAIAAMPALAWQPIETAPKDGRIIVAIRNEVGRSLPSFIMWDDIGGWGGMTADDERRVLKFWPTHWMPLPDAPAALEKKEAD